MIELITYPLDYPIWLLFFSWLIWLLLKWRNWPRPTISIMLIYSISAGIFYIKSLQEFNACMSFELCAPTFSLFPFIAAVSFWFMVLYVPIALALKPQSISEQIREKWWIAFLIIALAVWHVSVAAIGIIRSLEYFDSIAFDLFFFVAMVILLPWLFWLLLKLFRWSGPGLPTMFIYSIAVANASFRLLIEVIVYRVVSDVIFSLLLFLAEVTMWFIALYVLIKLTARIERYGVN